MRNIEFMNGNPRSPLSSDKATKGNMFHSIRKGLVSSQQANRNIKKLSKNDGSFKNHNDVHVTVTSPRTENMNLIATLVNKQADINQINNMNYLNHQTTSTGC